MPARPTAPSIRITINKPLEAVGWRFVTIVAEIEAEQKLVAASREFIERFEKKNQATLARIWGEGNTPPQHSP